MTIEEKLSKIEERLGYLLVEAHHTENKFAEIKHCNDLNGQEYFRVRQGVAELQMFCEVLLQALVESNVVDQNAFDSVWEDRVRCEQEESLKRSMGADDP